jgi:anti-anti-sigma regulatory factor
VRSELGDSRKPITVIEAIGEHEYASRGLLMAALEQVNGDVVVDLSSCTFIDTAVLGGIIGNALARQKAGHRLELVVPPTAPFAPMVDRLQIRMLLPVIEKLPAFASTSRCEHESRLDPPQIDGAPGDLERS